MPLRTQKKTKGRKKLPVKTELCHGCGHWSPATEFGLDEKAGYCDHWEKIMDATDTCPDWISREEYQDLQGQLAEEHEDYLDDD